MKTLKSYGGMLVEKAQFYLNVPNLSILEEKTKKNSGLYYDYQIISHVHLNSNDYYGFCENFLKGYEFLHKYIDSSRIENGIWKCILIHNTSCPQILVMTNGYQYPRFTALYKE